MVTASPLPDVVIRFDDAGEPHAILTFMVAEDTTAWEVAGRVSEAFKRSVKSVWIVFENIQQVFVYTSPTTVRVLTRADELTAEPVVPGFRLPMAELFPLVEPSV